MKNVNQIKTVCALTQGKNIPSSRFRWRQYTPYLIESGIIPFEKHSTLGAYPPKLNILRPPWFLANLAAVANNALRSNKYDLRFLQRQMISTLYTGESILKQPFILDVDDAIFLNQRFSGIDKIAKKANLIICGNEFLANYFSAFSEVKILPTAVDTERFIPNTKSKSKRVIVWSGSHGGLIDLYTIEPALKIILERFPDVLLKIVSDKPPLFTKLPEDQIVFQYWHSDTEVNAIQNTTIGIMPLPNGEWEKGKCSYKMLTYMSVGIPVVVSAIGMNIEVMKFGEAGFLAKTLDEWVDAISFLLEKQDIAICMGKIGRNIIEKYYATNIIGPELAKIIKAQ